MTDAPHAPTLQERLAIAQAAARCGASRKYDGCPCRQPAMVNGRCRLHGGKSTGARTAEGAERARQAVLRHGFYTAAARSERRQARSALSQLQALLANVQAR
jgi:hypothetical protein